MTTIKEISAQVTDLQANVSRLMSELEISRHENTALLEELKQANDLLYKVSAAIMEPVPESLFQFDVIMRFVKEKAIPVFIEGLLLASFLFILSRLF